LEKKIFTHTVKLHRRCDNIAQDIKEREKTTNKRFPIYTGCLVFMKKNNINSTDLSNICVYEFILRVCQINNNEYKKKKERKTYDVKNLSS